jgi:hypothetical protein
LEIWLRQQASTVMTALVHAQVLFGRPVPALAPRPFTTPPDLEDDLGGGWV